MSKSLKILLSVLALISACLSLAIVFDWNPLQKIKTGLTLTTTPSLERSEEEFKEKEKNIAQLTLSWLNSQKNEEGIYRISYSCLKDEDENVIYSSRIFPSVLWGKLKYYEKNSDYEGISELEKELDLAINTPTQNNQWNCKLMKDFWESNILSQEQKEKAKVYCRDTGGEGYSGSDMYNVAEIDSNELKNSILKNIDNIVNGLPVSFDEFYEASHLINDFEKVTAYVSNASARYLLEKEENESNEELINNLRKSALQNYYLALQGYSVIDKNIKDNSLLGIASLDLHRMTNEQKYLDMALYLFDENEKLENNKINYNYDYVYFGLFAKDLFDMTGNKLYKEKLKSIKNKIIEDQFIHPICKDVDNFILDTEKGGFRSGVGNFYLIGENSLMLGLLSI